MLKVIVDRKTWIRGQGGKGTTRLLTNDGLMCCLGFACHQAGYTKDDLRPLTTPSSLVKTKDLAIKNSIKQLIDKNSNFDSNICIKLMHENDRAEIKDSTREKNLRKLGKEAEIEFSFKG